MNQDEVTPITPQNDLEQLKLLFDYTKFHIGLYTSVATVFGGAIAARQTAGFEFSSALLMLAITFICIAGLAGGIIASSLTRWRGYSAFWSKSNRIGPFNTHWMTVENWSFVEHTSFWLAIACAVAAIGGAINAEN